MNRISLAEFNDRTEHAYAPVTAFNGALEHWTDGRGLLLGIVTQDRADNDFAYVVLGRDERNRFRAIEVSCTHSSVEAARDALHAMMSENIQSGAMMFPQDCLQ
jgi:hypothetical protein